MCATHSFYFSHRLWFFFQACLYSNDADGADQYTKAKAVVRAVKEISTLPNAEKLYLANSEHVLECLKDLNLMGAHPWYQQM